MLSFNSTNRLKVRYPHGHNCTEIPEHIEHAEQGLHWATIALLALLNLEWAFLLFVNGIRQFFKHWEFVLDMILVSTAMILTVLFHELELNPAAETIAELLLLILRLLRLMHAIFTIVEEEKDEEIKRLENRIRDLEGKLKQI